MAPIDKDNTAFMSCSDHDFVVIIDSGVIEFEFQFVILLSCYYQIIYSGYHISWFNNTILFLLLQQSQGSISIIYRPYWAYLHWTHQIQSPDIVGPVRSDSGWRHIANQSTTDNIAVISGTDKIQYEAFFGL